MSPEKPDALLWMDVETTGLDANKCSILEIGLRCTTLDAMRDQRPRPLLGRDPYTHRAKPTHRVHDCLDRDITEYRHYLTLMDPKETRPC